MIDGVPNPRHERKKRVDTIRHINIMHVCCCCGRELDTHWDMADKLDGRWMALEVDFSEIFGSFVADPKRILCNWCFGTGEWKKKGIKLR